MMTAITVAGLVEAARAHVDNLEPAQVAGALADPAVLVVDLRESEERAQHGIVAGTMHAPRGLLECYADPETAYYRAEFTSRRRIVLLCASGERSALAARTLQEMGYVDVGHLDGGLQAWRAAGHPLVAVRGWAEDG